MVRVVAEPTKMLLYSERNFAETTLVRAAGNMANIVAEFGFELPDGGAENCGAE